ncbi:MAG: helix-turn-helix domain-containing protein [Psychroserpens sp.]|uniref:helix-turn-helix domain-containing protein n=1 Tax=Psychroserpens sp. TaxID=2020870 RepID=UPI003002DF52
MDIALTIFSSIAVVSCLFMTTYFLIVRKEHKIRDFSLGFLFLAIAIRISKSIFSDILLDISYLVIALGLLGIAVMGPLILLYFKHSIVNTKTLSPKYLLHLIFPIVGFIIMILPNRKARDIYFMATIGLGMYLAVVGYKFIYNRNVSSLLTKWHNALYYAMFGLFSLFLLQIIIGTAQFYTVSIALMSLTIYILFFIAIKSPVLTRKVTPVQFPKGLLDNIVKAIEKDKIYIQPAITLAQFSEAINTPSYLVSKAIKSIYRKNFPEVINSFRIQDIKAKLSHIDYANEKIEILAYDVGFNTSSAFYLAFKKETSMSPRAYQKECRMNY